MRRKPYRDRRVQADLGFPPVQAVPADLTRKGIGTAMADVNWATVAESLFAFK